MPSSLAAMSRETQDPGVRHPSTGPTLLRDLGKWDLTAIGVNIIVGAGIFLVPSQVAAQVGVWAPLFGILLGLTSLLIGLCFAEVSSRFDGTGGPYLYTRVAFGRFAGFEVGWMYWFTRVSAQASVLNGLMLALGFYWPAVSQPLGRVLLMAGLTGFLVWINVRGIRQTSWLVNALTLGKMLPLLVFIAAGVFWIDWSRLVPTQTVSWREGSAAALLLLFIFSGYEVVPVPAGEAANPRRHAPFAIVAAILITTAVNTLVLAVCVGTLPGLATSKTPLADAALGFLGAGGALLIAVGSIVSIAGNNAGQILTASRMLFALASHGDLPRVFGVIHPRNRTPANAVLFTGGVALTLALTGSFAALAAASAVSRLLTYVGVCASTLALRRRSAQDDRLKPPTFVVPLGSTIPVLALVACAGIFAGVTQDQMVAGVLALAGGAALFAVAGRAGRLQRPGVPVEEQPAAEGP
jgi:basic amino acid/polyamine antiporter, APA family